MGHPYDGRPPQEPPYSHCWLEVPDLTAVDCQSPAHILLLISDPKEGPRLSRILSGQGHRVTLAADWDHALSQLHDAPELELMITDLADRDEHGIGPSHDLGTPYILSSLPVIVLCREQDLTPLMNQWANGAADFLSRPYSDTELLVRVRRALIQQRTMRLYLRAAHRDPPHRALQQADFRGNAATGDEP